MSKRRKKKNKFARPFIAFLIIFTALFIPLNYLLDKVGDVRIFGGKTNLMDEMGTLLNENSPFFEAFNNSDRVNVLVMGINDNMTDTLMLASYDTENQKVDIISIPRDTYYERPGKSGASLKINSIYSQEGVLGTAKAVSKTLEGIPINYYVVVDYKGVEKVVDAMGGVKVNVPFHMKYRDVYDKPPLIIDIPAGERTLSGKEAIKFLRFRKTNMRGGQGYPQGDIGRIQTHQAFLKAAVDKAIGPKLPKVMKTFIENVDSDLSLRIGIKLATKAIKLDNANVKTYLLPGIPPTKSPWYWTPDQPKIQEMLKEIYASETKEKK